MTSDEITDSELKREADRGRTPDLAIMFDVSRCNCGTRETAGMTSQHQTTPTPSQFH